VTVAEVQKRIKELHEENPMLGLRGCRLGIVYLKITDMQVGAIFEAACNVAAKGVKVLPEIMVPLVGAVAELSFVKKRIDKIGAEVMAAQQQKVEYQTGTMIEVPRAALVADAIAKEAEFFSFGTNDLTQTTFGYSRDDVGSFVPEYQELKILGDDPFQVLDQTGVGSLIKLGIEKGRSVRKDLKVGICGEHGGEPSSVIFCALAGMNYVSCSPYRVPTARLAAAQAALKK
jgi:pyruvate,orthophosphate dikinase